MLLPEDLVFRRSRNHRVSQAEQCLSAVRWSESMRSGEVRLARNAVLVPGGQIRSSLAGACARITAQRILHLPALRGYRRRSAG